MKNMSFFILTLLIAGATISLNADPGAIQEEGASFSEKDAQKLYESLDEKNKAKWNMIESWKKELTFGLFSSIVFYGKVVDQNGDPVHQTRISIITEVFTPNPLTLYSTKKRTRFSSDSNGFFYYKGVGRMISVYIWPPDGYEHTEQSSSRDFYYGQTYDNSVKQFHNPDKNNPVIFRLRKKSSAVLSFDYGQVLRGMEPDKDYYSDMFYHKSRMQYIELNELPKIEPERFYPQVKVHQTYRKESENTHIFTLDVEFLGNFQIQRGKWNALLLPEGGYEGKTFHVTYKIVRDEQRDRFKNYLLSDKNEWILYAGSSFSLFAKTGNNYYGIVELSWSPHWYLKRDRCISLLVNYRFNSVPDQRVFEDDSALRRKIEYSKRKEMKEKLQNEIFKGAKSLSEILKDAEGKKTEKE